jgi:hypothetical protein
MLLRKKNRRAQMGWEDHIAKNIQISCQQSVNLYAHEISKNLLPRAFTPSEKVKVLYHFLPKFFPSSPQK